MAGVDQGAVNSVFFRCMFRCDVLAPNSNRYFSQKFSPLLSLLVWIRKIWEENMKSKPPVQRFQLKADCAELSGIGSRSMCLSLFWKLLNWATNYHS